MNPLPQYSPNIPVPVAPTPVTPGKTLDYIYTSSGFQKETMVDLLLEDRRKDNDEYNKEQAELDVTNYLDTQEQAILGMLKKARNSPAISRENQSAVLKGMIMDYEHGKNRHRLTPLTVIKAIEALNRMTGYEAPQVVEHSHEIKVNVFPVSEAPFKGSLPPLDVVDLGDASIAYDPNQTKTLDAISPGHTPEPTPEELFP